MKIPFTTIEKNLEYAKSLAKEIKSFCFSCFDANDYDKFEILYFNGDTEIIWFQGYEYYNRHDLHLIKRTLDYIVRTYGKLYLEKDEQYKFEVELPHFHMTVTKCTEIEKLIW